MTAARARWAICCLLLGLPSAGLEHARAQPDDARPENELAPTLAELMATRRGLVGAQASVRLGAYRALSELGPEAMPVIQQRLKTIAGAGLDAKALQQHRAALMRRAGGGDKAAAKLDLAAAVERALDYDQSEPTALLAELAALLRSLESQQSIQAAQVIVSELFALEPRLFRQEAIRTRKKLGKLMLPAMLRHRVDARPELQKLAREALTALGMNSDERVFQLADAELLAASIDALGASYTASDTHDARQLAQVPWVVAHLDDARPAVRAAARRTVKGYGDAAAQALRARALDLTGVPPDATSGPDPLLVKLLEQADGPRNQEASSALQAARSALHKGELAQVEQQLDRALSAAPPPPLAQPLARVYSELAQKLDAANLPVRALVASRRALRLDPTSSTARARVLYLEAEQRLSSGVADLQALTTASALDPQHPSARPLLEELRGERIKSAQALRRQLGFVAAALVALAACFVLYLRRAARQRSTAAPRRTFETV